MMLLPCCKTGTPCLGGRSKTFVYALHLLNIYNPQQDVLHSYKYCVCTLLYHMQAVYRPSIQKITLIQSNVQDSFDARIIIGSISVSSPISSSFMTMYVIVPILHCNLVANLTELNYPARYHSIIA